jgi:hypothetical protein
MSRRTLDLNALAVAWPAYEPPDDFCDRVLVACEPPRAPVAVEPLRAPVGAQHRRAPWVVGAALLAASLAFVVSALHAPRESTQNLNVAVVDVDLGSQPD